MPETDGTRARVKLSASTVLNNGAQFDISGYYDGIGLDDYESYGLEMGLNWKF
ncbi:MULTISPECIES: hypothetical protein [unclassified Aliiroseovarius]|uniref:hypothetical protein n=1 Tax=unclassified Aliiroseovarius TaxID=2623558 RepID=UPI00156810AB|nr:MULTISPECIES: hypothetical protein [unclassified Aliiroseovarius]